MRHSTCAVFILVVQLGLQLSTAILPVDWPALTVPDNIPLQYTGDVSCWPSTLAIYLQA